MICPNCAAMGRRSDGVCYNCHQPFPSGLRRQTVMAWFAAAFALITLVAVILIVPIRSAADIGASLCVGTCLASATASAGALMGWILGTIICEH